MLKHASQDVQDRAMSALRKAQAWSSSQSDDENSIERREAETERQRDARTNSPIDWQQDRQTGKETLINAYITKQS